MSAGAHLPGLVAACSSLAERLTCIAISCRETAFYKLHEIGTRTRRRLVRSHIQIGPTIEAALAGFNCPHDCGRAFCTGPQVDTVKDYLAVLVPEHTKEAGCDGLAT